MDTVTFQSTTLATPPDATVIATDDAGAAGQVQIIKQAISANGDATPIPATVADGLLVNLGTNNDVTVAALPLPSGAATAAKQDTGNTSLATLVTQTDAVEASLSTLITQTDGVEASLASIDGKITAVNTGAVVVASSALPTGASTEATLSTRALESGGNLAAAATSLAILDDWDESDRAKVNPIVGQAGVAAGAGAVAATVQRMTLASDDPAVVALQVMDDWDESDRAKVNIIVGQAGVTAGAGAVAANTPRVTHASDDPVTTSLQLIDDAVITDDTTTFTPTTSKGLAIAGAVDDDSTDAADEGDMAIVRITKERKLRVVNAYDSASMQSGNDQVTPKFAVIAAASSGDNTLVTGVSNKKIRVLNYVLMSNGTVNAKFQSSTGGDITGLLYMVANTGASSGYAPTGHFETVAGEDLQLNLSGAIAVGGHLSYIEVD